MNCNLTSPDDAAVVLGFIYEAQNALTYKVNNNARNRGNREHNTSVFGQSCTSHAHKLLFPSHRSKF